MSRNETSRGRTAFVALLACCLLTGMLVPAPVLAGDNTTIIYFEPDEIEADPGEEVTVDIIVSDHGDYNANGIDELSFDLEYDADVFTVTDVEHQSMLAAGDSDAEVVGSAEIDDEVGIVAVEQEREPSGDGARSTEPAVTVTIEIDEDASPTTETLEITNASAILVTDYPQSVVERDATVHVDGGEEPTDESAGDADSDDGPDGVTLADDSASNDATDDGSDDTTSNEPNETAESTADGSAAENSSAETDSAPEGDADGDGDDPVSGFGVSVGIVGAATALSIGIVRSRR
ncbi:cohesin domain-containing protein [Natrialbaceae archaeon A-arb3/5]